MGNIADKLGYLLGTKHRIRQALQNKGAIIPEETPFRQYANLIDGMSIGGNGPTHDVTNVTNNATYNPGTHVGGITWVDPSTDPPTDPEIVGIEIFDLFGAGMGSPVSVAEIPLGVQRWEPEVGIHQYHIGVKFADGSYSPGVDLPLTEYSIDYVAHLLTAFVPLTDPKMLVLGFDNYVKITDGTGFSVAGVNDSLEYVDKPDDKTVRLRLATKCFVQGLTYKLSYDPAGGTLLQNDDSPVAAINMHGILNYSDYLPTVFAAAEIPQAQPGTLVVAMSRDVTIIDDSRFSLTGTTAGILGVVSPVGNNTASTIEFALTEPVDADETAIRLTMLDGGMVDDIGQPVLPFANAIVLNNSPHTAIGVLTAEVPSSAPGTVVIVMDGAVTVDGETSGEGALPGMDLTVGDQDPAPEVTGWEISDGTITLHLDGNVLMDKAVGIAYDETGGMRAVHGNDTVRAFALAATNHSAYFTQPLGDLPLGAKVKYGATGGDGPLTWVVADKNHAGYPANSVTLFMGDSAITGEFDAAEPGNPVSGRPLIGNSRYSLSNLRQWANSAAPAGEWYAPTHAHDQPPSYASRAGFLHAFTPGERAALLDTTIVVNKAPADGGGQESVTCKVFLPSIAELGLAQQSGEAAEGTALQLLAGAGGAAHRMRPFTSQTRSPYMSLRSDNFSGAWTDIWLIRILSNGTTLTEYNGHCLPSAAVFLYPVCNLYSSVLVTGGPDAEGCYSLV